MELSVYKIDGSESGKKVALDEKVFGVEPNDHAIYLDVLQYLANQRQGTSKTKDRNSVARRAAAVHATVPSRSVLSSVVVTSTARSRVPTATSSTRRSSSSPASPLLPTRSRLTPSPLSNRSPSKPRRPRNSSVSSPPSRPETARSSSCSRATSTTFISRPAICSRLMSSPLTRSTPTLS